MRTEGGYSAKVALWLLVAGTKLELSHVGPDYVRVRDAVDPITELCDAELVISVNDQIERKPVFVPHGVPRSPERVTYW